MEWHRKNRKKNHKFSKEDNVIRMKYLRCRNIKLLRKGLNCKLMSLEYKWGQLEA
jgi:hypothetical protein